MKWIGLTGGLGSGKSTVASILRRKGFPVIDADAIARQLVQPGTSGLRSVVEAFGPGVVGMNGALDRGAMAREVFSKPEKLAQLEALLHPLVQKEVQDQKRAYQGSGFRIVFYDVPLLFEKNLSGFDLVVVVDAPESLRRTRLKSRNNWTDEDIDQRMASQLPLEDKVKKADHVIMNAGDLKELEKNVEKFLQTL